jgi:hypothetical protein
MNYLPCATCDWKDDCVKSDKKCRLDIEEKDKKKKDAIRKHN